MNALLDQWNKTGSMLKDALEQHAETRSIAKEAVSRSTVGQIAVSSLGTQIDDAEKRVHRRIDKVERKIDALLRAAGLKPESFEDV